MLNFFYFSSFAQLKSASGRVEYTSMQENNNTYKLFVLKYDLCLAPPSKSEATRIFPNINILQEEYNDLS